MGHLRDPEIEQLHGDLSFAAAREEDIRGLDVAVDHPGRVRPLQPEARLRRDAERELGREARHPQVRGVEVLSFQELHDQIRVAGGGVGSGVQDLGDVGRLDGPRGPRFALEALHDRRGDEERIDRDYLHGDAPLRREVTRLVDCPHSPFSDRANELVLAVQDAVRGGWVHGRIRGYRKCPSA